MKVHMPFSRTNSVRLAFLLASIAGPLTAALGWL